MPKILLAEDSSLAAATLAHMLKGLGHEVIVAKDGEEIISLFPSVRPDLLVLDHNLPLCSGPDALRRVRLLDGGQGVPVIFVSAKPPTDPAFAPSRLLRTLPKPPSRDKLAAAIAELLGPKRG